jgi:GT2 family glycosyltransferase/spore maturation protein CgeB
MLRTPEDTDSHQSVTAPADSPALLGYVDRLEGAVVMGWARWADQETPSVTVELLVDGQPVGRTVAEEFRADVQSAGVGDGRCGYALVVPDTYRDGQDHVLDVREVGSGRVLEGSLLPFRSAPAIDPAGGLVGNIDRMLIEGESIAVVGWARDTLVPERRVKVAIVLDGECVGLAVACDLRGDLVAAEIGDGAYSFTVRLPLAVKDSLARLVAVIDDRLTIQFGPLEVVVAPADPVKRIGLLDPPVVDGESIRISGWTFEPSVRSHKARVEVRLGKTSAAVFATLPRADVAEWGVHDGYCGFEVKLPLVDGHFDLGALQMLYVDGSPFVIAPSPGELALTDWPPAPASDNEFAAGLMVHHGVLRGWVAQHGSLEPLQFSVELDGQFVWRGTANRIEEIELAGRKRKAAHGLRVELPTPAGQTLFHRVSVLTNDGRHFPGSPLCFVHGDEYDGTLECVTRQDDDAILVQGWCLNRRRPSEPVPLRVTDRWGKELATGLADLRLADPAKAGFDSPFGGYSIEVPAAQASQGVLVWPASTRCALTTLSVADQDLRQLALPSRMAAAPSFADVDDSIKVTIDEISQETVRGWARCESDPARTVFLDLFIDDVLVATTSARRFRSDLASHFKDHGCHEYLFELSSAAVWQRPGKVAVRPRRGVGKMNSVERFLPLRDIVGTEVSRGLTTFVRDRYHCRPGSDDAPAVSLISCIVLNLNGAPLLRRLFESFSTFNSQRCEFVIVDHASSDDSAGVCAEWGRKLPVRFFDRGANHSFSDSNNYGVRQAAGDLLLFLNNDVRLCDDILPGVAAMFRDSTLGALGVRLLDDTPLPADDPCMLDSVRTTSHAVQHLGVHMNLRSGRFALHPFESRYSAPWREATNIAVEVPVVTGAFLACRRTDFEEIGGFEERYYYGYEDVDLCLKVRKAGKRVVCANHLPALHLRAYSRLMMDSRYDNARIRNLEAMDDRFGLQVRRSLALDRFVQPGFWTNAMPKIGFVVTSTDPNTMAGDYFTALEMADALAAEYPVRCFFVTHGSPEVGDLRGLDVLIAMRDDFDPTSIKRHDPHLLKVAWVRNWFGRFAERPLADRFNAVWASSSLAAAQLQQALGRPVQVVPIATNAQRFSKGVRQSEFECDYCFTGSYWGLNREIIQMLDPAALPYEFAIFGEGWKDVPKLAPFARGPLPYARMPDIYASTKLVIDDANHVTKSWASVNSRVFDALAAGALVLTNGRAGARELFGEALPTYDTPQELEDLLHTYLMNEELRQAKVQELQRIVFADHTYRERARCVWKNITAASSATRIAIKIGAPRRVVREEWGDYHFACGMQHALEQLGYLVRVDCIEEWACEASNADDVVIVLRGLTEYKPRRDQISLLWIISHPDRVCPAEMAAFDHVFVASTSFAALLAPQLGGSVSPLLQCTDERYFHPEVEPVARPSPVLFVGNSREQYRPIVRDAIAAGLDLHVYGTRWSGFIPENYVQGEHVPNSELASHYRSAGVVLNDHWDTMRDHGFISNRLFDAAACGARIVSDRIAGLAEIFGDLVAEYDDADDLAEMCARLLAETDADRARRDEFGRRIIAEHSFHARMQKMANVIERSLEVRSAAGSLYGAV